MPDYTVSTLVAKETRNFGPHAVTTDATVTVAATVTTGASRIYTIKAIVNGMTSDTTTDQASYVLVGLFKNVAGTLTQVGSTTVVSSIESNAAWDCAFAVVAATATVPATVVVNVTGVAATTIFWHAQVEVIQGQAYAPAFGVY
jgi:hypothetical protein